MRRSVAVVLTVLRKELTDALRDRRTLMTVLVSSVLLGPLALLGVYLGQIFGVALLAASANDLSVTTVLTDHFSFVQQAWKHDLGAMDVFFYAVAGLEGFVIAKRAAN